MFNALRWRWHMRRNRRYFLKSGVNLIAAVTVEGNPPSFRITGKTLFEPCSFRSIELMTRISVFKSGSLVLKEGVYINQGSNIASVDSIVIGEDTMIGEEVTIIDSAFHATTPDSGIQSGPVKIGRNVWIGNRCIIMPNVSIGNHSVIGANSVVTKDVPEKTIVAGNPCRVLKTFECDDDYLRSGDIRTRF